MREKLGLTFPLLIDEGSKVIRSYGLLNESQGEIPHPATLVIDREGVVRWMRIDIDYKKRPPVADVLAALDELADPPDSPSAEDTE